MAERLRRLRCHLSPSGVGPGPPAAPAPAAARAAEPAATLADARAAYDRDGFVVIRGAVRGPHRPAPARGAAACVEGAARAGQNERRPKLGRGPQVPADLLALTKRVLAAWADATVDSWVAEGRLTDARRDLPFATRLAALWEVAGRPRYSRSPRRDLVSAHMYALHTHPALLDVAEALCRSADVLSHSIFNGRPKLPAQSWTDTPWHQDAQVRPPPPPRV
jgi:hypothetical protein